MMVSLILRTSAFSTDGPDLPAIATTAAERILAPAKRDQDHA